MKVVGGSGMSKVVASNAAPVGVSVMSPSRCVSRNFRAATSSSKTGLWGRTLWAE